MAFELKQDVRCVNDRGTNEMLKAGWSYRVLEVHPETKGIRINKYGVFWDAWRFKAKKSKVA